MQNDWCDDIEIREMKETDVDEVLAIEKRSFVAPWSKRVFRETIAFPHSFNLVARKKVDNRMIGYANFYLIKDEAHMLNIAIAPDSRKKGYAGRLLGYAIDALRQKGAGEFFLEVREGNEDAKKLYRKLGFTMIGRRKKYYTETNEDALVMYLKVDDGQNR